MLLLLLALIETDADRQRMALLFQQHRFTMLHVADTMLHDQHQAEDAASEAFLRVARNIGRVREGTETRAFLVAIVKNICCDMLKVRKVVPLLSLDQIAYDAPDEIDIEDAVEQRDELDALGHAVNELPDIYASVFLLKYKHNYEDADIARFLNINEPLVRKRLQRAKERIATMMKEEQLVGKH
jgi:RNA polymerase sigma-70 factor (ECF subfamily)